MAEWYVWPSEKVFSSVVLLRTERECAYWIFKAKLNHCLNEYIELCVMNNDILAPIHRYHRIHIWLWLVNAVSAVCSFQHIQTYKKFALAFRKTNTSTLVRVHVNRFSVTLQPQFIRFRRLSCVRISLFVRWFVRSVSACILSLASHVLHTLDASNAKKNRVIQSPYLGCGLYICGSKMWVLSIASLKRVRVRAIAFPCFFFSIILLRSFYNTRTVCPKHSWQSNYICHTGLER